MTEKEKEARISDLLGVAAMIASYRAHTITEDWLERSKQLLAAFDAIDRLTEGKEKPYTVRVGALKEALREAIAYGGAVEKKMVGTARLASRIASEIAYPVGDGVPCCVKCWWAQQTLRCNHCGDPIDACDLDGLANLTGIPSVDDILTAEEMHRQEIEAQSHE